MGYPFDRMPRDGVNTLQDFLTPNMFVRDVTIKFTNRTVGVQGGDEPNRLTWWASAAANRNRRNDQCFVKVNAWVLSDWWVGAHGTAFTVTAHNVENVRSLIMPLKFQWEQTLYEIFNFLFLPLATEHHNGHWPVHLFVQGLKQIQIPKCFVLFEIWVIQNWNSRFVSAMKRSQGQWGVQNC